MMHAEVIHPSRLTAADRRLWQGWCAATPAFQNPLLGPEFAEAVAAVRGDARVAVLKDDGETVGVLAFHLRPSGFARPIGAPFSDYHGLISGRRIDGAAALAAANLTAFRYSALVDPFGCFAQGEAGEGFVMRLEEGGCEAYLDRLKAMNPKRFKNWRRLENKLEREVGPLQMRGPDTDPHAYDLLMRWKRDQLRRTGLHDFLGPPWTQDLMQRLFDTRTGALQGLMVTLRAGDRIVAGHFGVRLGDVYHPWIASMDPDGGAWSPGQTLLSQAIRAMPGLGLSAYDLAPSHGHYKAPFCLQRAPVTAGLATAATKAGRRREAAEGAWAAAGRSAPAVGRLHRRLDHIAAIELSTAGRLKGLIEAVAGQARRSRTAGVDDALSGV